MTGDEWVEICDEVEWLSVTPDLALAIYQRIADALAEDVWDAAWQLTARPTPDTFAELVDQVVGNRKERARLQAAGLPESPTDLGWEAWRDRLGYSSLSVRQAIEQRHMELFPNGCPYDCPLHYGAEAA